MLVFLKKSLKVNSLSSRTIFYLLGTVIIRGIGIFTAPLFTRLLLPEEFGNVAIFTMLASFISIIIGTYSHGGLAVAMITFEEKEKENFLSSALTLSTLSGVIFTTVFFLFKDFLIDLLKIESSLVSLLMAYSFVIFIIDFYLTKLAQERKQVLYLLLSFIVMISTTLASILFIWFLRDGFWGRIYGFVIPSIFIALVLYSSIMFNGHSYFNISYWRFSLNFSLPLILHCFSSLALVQVDRLMIQHFMDLRSVGIYSIAYTFGLIIEMLWGSFNLSWVPTYYQNLKNESYEIIERQCYNYIKTFTFISIIFILVSPEFFRLFTVETYWAGIPVVAMVAFSGYLRFSASFLVNYQLYINKTVWTALATLMAAITNIFLNIYMIPRLGIIGAAISTVISYLVLLFVNQVAVIFIGGIKHKTGIYFGLFYFLIALIVLYLSFDYFFPRLLIASCSGIYLAINIIKNKSLF